MQYVLYDLPKVWEAFKPLTFTRSVAELRVGIFTILEKWENHIGTAPFLLTDASLQNLYPPLPIDKPAFFVHSGILPDEKLITEIQQLKQDEALFLGDIWIAGRGVLNKHQQTLPQFSSKKQLQNSPQLLQFLWDIFKQNANAIEQDLTLIRKQSKKYQVIQDKYTVVYSPENVFIEQGADIKACILNASQGSIYIGKNAQIQEGAILQGPIALGEGAVVNIGAKIRGGTTIGKFCKVGGEISNSIFLGYSNKAHDGFLGNSVIGEWCNLGADTNNSNLKNNYSSVKVWHYPTQDFIDTGLQFCGLFMGDHSKAGINTMFNTGTSVGVGCNIFGGDFPPKFVPSFRWGGVKGFERYDFDKFLQTAQAVMQRRQKSLTTAEINLFQQLYNTL